MFYYISQLITIKYGANNMPDIFGHIVDQFSKPVPNGGFFYDGFSGNCYIDLGILIIEYKTLL